MLLPINLVCAALLAVACDSTFTSKGDANAFINSKTATFYTSFEIIDNDQTGDATLNSLKAADRASRTTDGKIVALTADEMLRRAGVFAANRLFSTAREYWLEYIERYPNHASIPAALFGVGRSFYQERRFAEALPYFERGSADDYAATKEGRDCFYYVAPTLLRLNRAAEAARKYEEYAQKFPAGERFEAAHLNAIDTWREAGNTSEALRVVRLTQLRFPNSPTATNAQFARLRLEIAAANWQTAIETADEMLRAKVFTNTSTSANEVNYLRAYALEKSGKKEAAIKAYLSIPDGLTSYYGGLATQRLSNLKDAAAQRQAQTRQAAVNFAAQSLMNQYPAAFREDVLRVVRGKNVDPRLMLAVMRQESSFNPRAKSAAAARGLMQLTVDTAAKYSVALGMDAVTEEALYNPATNLKLASEYLAQLNLMFNNLAEAVAASYNGGEDNAARWQKRASSKGGAKADTEVDAGIFASEIGFSETKDYVQKVMANYRAYRALYTQDLRFVKNQSRTLNP